MIKNSYRYVLTKIDMPKFLADTANEYIFVAQRPSKEKRDSDGNITLEEGTTCTLSILTDNSEPLVDKTTGAVKDNNVFETFDVTIVGKPYPLPFSKGDHVSLDQFDEDHSFYLDYNLILRFRDISLSKKKD